MKTDRTEESKRRAEMLKLYLIDKLSIRAIANKLRMSRNTVRAAVGRPVKKNPPPAPKASMLAHYDVLLRRMLEEIPELKAPVVLERLRAEGYRGGITILRDRMRLLRPRPKEAFLSLNFRPGEAVQVDWADFGFALPGCPRRVSAFVMALCHSRYLYLEFALSQSMGSFLRRMENGVRFFGGTTHVDIFDNMRTVVTSHSSSGTVFNSRFLDYARARGFAVRACNVARGNEKGRVERPIGFVRERFWPGRRFIDLRDLNVQARRWQDEFANQRVHEVTGKVPALVFEHEERNLLQPISGKPFETDEIEGTSVTKSFRVSFDRNVYSVPPGLVSQNVVVRANDEVVRIFLGPKEVARHSRCWEVGQVFEDEAHRQAALEMKPGANRDALSPAIVALGEIGRRYLEVASAGTKSLQRETLRLVFLVELFSASATSVAMEEVLRTGHVGAEYVEYVLRHKKGLAPSAPPLKLGRPELDDLCFKEPDLAVYDALFPPTKTVDPGGAPDPENGKGTP